MIALFQSYFSATVTRLSTFINVIPQFTKGFDACVSISEVLCADNYEHRGTMIPATFNGEVRFSSVGFRYKDIQVLKDLSLEIPAKSSIAIVGGSGSGKSTLLKLLLGFILPADGHVSVDGTDLGDMDLSRYRKHLAVVPQHSMLFSGTLLQNLMYGAPLYVSRSRVMEVIRQVGLEDFVSSLPKGLDSPISESGSNLSGGQSQRISIARALLRDPKILILDEPTSALDRESEQRVLGILDDIMGTCTIIMVAHRLNTVKRFDSIAVLDNGVVAEQGTYDELIAAGGLFCRMMEEPEALK
jgi:ATP-binding cassette subfamily B protein